jgi:hypothetical protein
MSVTKQFNLFFSRLINSVHLQNLTFLLQNTIAVQLGSHLLHMRYCFGLKLSLIPKLSLHPTSFIRRNDN